jgi:hypothetical protein
LGLFLSIGVAASWWFLLPAAYLPLIFYLAKNNLLLNTLKSFKKMLAILIIGTLSALPVAVSLFLSTKVDPINEPGGVDKLSLNIFLYFIFSCLVFLVIKRKEALHLINSYLWIFLGTSVFLCAFVALYQIVTINELRYYFFKNLFTLYLALLIIFTVYAIHLIDEVLSRISVRLITGLVFGVILLAIVGVGVKSEMIYARVYVNNWYNHAVEENDLKIIFLETSNKYSDTFYLGDCNPASDYLSNRWAGARYLSDKGKRNEASVDVLLGRDAEFRANFTDYIGEGINKLLVVDNRCGEKYKQLINLVDTTKIDILYTN